MKYRVTLVQTVTEGCFLEVEADDQEAAEKKALAIALGEHPDAFDPDKCPMWNFRDVVDNAEVTDCEEWPPQRDEPPDQINTPSGVIDLASGGGTDSRAVVVDHTTGEVINLMDALRATIKEGE